MTTTTFFLVRHGQTVWNLQERVQGIQDSPLTSQGWNDARSVAARLEKVRFDAVFTSDLLRARHTAKCIAQRAGVELIVDLRLRETNNGLFEGKTRAEAAAEFPEIYAQYALRRPDYAIPGGESRQAVQERAIDFFTQVARANPGGCFVAVSHGGLLSTFVCAILGLPLAKSRAFWLANGGLSQVTYHVEREPSTAEGPEEGATWQLVTLNETQHLSSRDEQP